jgi:hypothetical protein
MLIFVSKRAKPSELPRLLGEQSVCLRHKGFVSQGEDASMYPLNNQLSHPDINFYNFVADPWQMNLSFDYNCSVPHDLPILPDECLVGHTVKTCVSVVTKPAKLSFTSCLCTCVLLSGWRTIFSPVAVQCSMAFSGWSRRWTSDQKGWWTVIGW